MRMRIPPHSVGVAMMIAQETEGAHIGWEVHGQRLMKASFWTAREKIMPPLMEAQSRHPTQTFWKRGNFSI